MKKCLLLYMPAAADRFGRVAPSGQEAPVSTQQERESRETDGAERDPHGRVLECQLYLSGVLFCPQVVALPEFVHVAEALVFVQTPHLHSLHSTNPPDM